MAAAAAKLLPVPYADAMQRLRTTTLRHCLFIPTKTRPGGIVAAASAPGAGAAAAAWLGLGPRLGLGPLVPFLVEARCLNRFDWVRSKLGQGPLGSLKNPDCMLCVRDIHPGYQGGSQNPAAGVI